MTFTSAVLGAVQHPTNILTEYLSRFRGVKKFKAYILSWLDGWMHKKLQEGKPPWVYVVNQELAEALGCCRDTVFRHLKDLCEMGIVKKLPYKRWATDHIWAYTIDFDKLKQELSPFAPAENQTVERLISDSRESDFSQSVAENQTLYRSLTLNSTQQQTEHNLPTAEEENKQIELPKQESARKKEKQIDLTYRKEATTKPTKEELDFACTQISRLSPQVQTNIQVKAAIEKYWAKPPERSQQITSDDRQGDWAIATSTKESPQQDLEVAESPESPQVSEPQIPTDSSQGQQDEEKQSLSEPEPIEALEPQIPTDFHQVDPQPELEPPTELPDVEDSPSDAERSPFGKSKPSSASRQSALLKTPLLPQYQHLNKSEAVEQLLQKEESKVLHVNYIIRALHGELTPSDADAEKPRMLETLKKGVAKGLWDRVPDSPGCYTADVKLVDSEAEQKLVEEKKPQRRKPNSKATEGMLPRYRGLTFTDAVETVLRDRSGEIVTSDIMARTLYGDLEGQELTQARNKVGKVPWSGANQGRWQSVPGQKGAYTLQLGS